MEKVVFKYTFDCEELKYYIVTGDGKVYKDSFIDSAGRKRMTRQIRPQKGGRFLIKGKWYSKAKLNDLLIPLEKEKTLNKVI